MRLPDRLGSVAFRRSPVRGLDPASGAAVYGVARRRVAVRLAVGLGWAVLQLRTPEPQAAMWFDFVPTPPLVHAESGNGFALTPDGSWIIYQGEDDDGEPVLWRTSLYDRAPEVIENPKADGPRYLFVAEGAPPFPIAGGFAAGRSGKELSDFMDEGYESARPTGCGRSRSGNRC